MGCAWRWAMGLNTRGSKNEMLNVLSGSRNAFRTVENVFTGLALPTNRHTTTAPVYANICALISTRSPLPHHTLLPISQQLRHRSFVHRAGSNNSQTADDAISSAALYRGTQKIYIYVVTALPARRESIISRTHPHTHSHLYIYTMYTVYYI